MYERITKLIKDTNEMIEDAKSGEVVPELIKAREILIGMLDMDLRQGDRTYLIDEEGFFECRNCESDQYYDGKTSIVCVHCDEEYDKAREYYKKTGDEYIPPTIREINKTLTFNSTVDQKLIKKTKEIYEQKRKRFLDTKTQDNKHRLAVAMRNYVDACLGRDPDKYRRT